MVLKSTLILNQKGFEFLRKMKSYPDVHFNALNTVFKSSFSRGIWGFGTRSSMICGYETLTEITDSEEKGKKDKQLAVVTPQPFQRLVGARGPENHVF